MSKNFSADYAAYTTLDIVGGKWSLYILNQLQEGPVRFCTFSYRIPGLTQKVLTKQLRYFEEQGIVRRKVYPESPPKVEYRLTEHGMTLLSVMERMEEWGRHHQQVAGTHNRGNHGN